ncbi:MAG: tetratricopeptide repeat protein [Bacteroidetes bacterium]|jgi:tetratricopeptide (TPR) repeat protein|nr:tetratricopeptide repeat protein [Bacteroidota bacterium]MBT4968034.1 tetratricopeptide repeat protein [Bacteroidota bacterium]MBT6836918.1 tetratricopeptide repeat protein [Bacteroidota bacterium]
MIRLPIGKSLKELIKSGQLFKLEDNKKLNDMDNFTENNDFLKKTNPRDLISMGMKFGRQKKFEDALQMFEAYLAIDPWDPLIINNKADCYVGMKKFDDAKEIELYALTLNPRLAIGWVTLGEIQSLTNEKFSARLNIEQAEKLSKKDDNVYPVIKEHLKNLKNDKPLNTNIYL